MSKKQENSQQYLHGFSHEEQKRLYSQARFLEERIHQGISLHRSRNLLEVGCGVGAQTEILLRRYPQTHITGLDASLDNLKQAESYLSKLCFSQNRYDLVHENAEKMSFKSHSFDGAFLCWILEHVPDPAMVLSEVRRVLTPGSSVIISEVQNATFFLEPYSPNTLAYWTAFNDHQLDLGGDPFVGAKLGNLLQRVGFRDIQTSIKTIHLDNRNPAERAEFIQYWTELLLSGAEGLLKAEKTTPTIVEKMKEELYHVSRNPDSVFYYSFIQATAFV